MTLPSPFEITFEQEGHTYTCKAGYEVQSVTTILDAVGLYPTFYCDPRYATFGTYGHRVVYLAISRKLNRQSIHPDFMPWMPGIDKFVADAKPKPTMMEVPMWHPLYRFAGTPDYVGEAWGEEWLLDWKFWEHEHKASVTAAEIQVTAYDEMVKYAEKSSPLRRKLGIVQFTRDGYRLRTVQAPRSRQWFAALTVYEAQQNGV